MLIISHFHDYYDTASIHGVDKTCVYKRDTSEVKKIISKAETSKWPYEEEFTSKKGDQYLIQKYLIGFCGEIYPVIQMHKNGSELLCFYDAKKARKFLLDEGMDNYTGKYKYYRRYFGEEQFTVNSEQSLKRFFDKNQWIKFKDVFATYNSPTFVFGRPIDGRKPALFLNPELKSFRFAAMKDPQTAFQDIYMYLSGVLGAPIPPKEKISDKVMAESKGHGGKYSFKKPPGKRGKNKWR